MMATTTKSSINVKAERREEERLDTGFSLRKGGTISGWRISRIDV